MSANDGGPAFPRIDTRATAEVLRRALEGLREWGWAQKSFEAEDGRRCSIGAINRVPDTSYVVRRDAERTLRVAVDGVFSRSSPREIFAWNDAPERTWPEVEAAFLRAIEIAEGRTTEGLR